MEKITLLDGKAIPVLGYGTWQNVDPSECVNGVVAALEAGYRHIDTAQMYGNEALVGEGLRQSGLAREEVFITSKINNNHHAYDDALRSIDESLEALGTDYIDLMLIHWPVVAGHEDDWRESNIQTWRALEDAQAAGKLRSIGLSNFKVEHLENLLPHCRVKPVINQLRLHPGVLQEETVALSRQAGMAIEAWSPLSPISQMKADAKVLAMTEKYKKSIAQLLLRYAIEKEYIPLTKSVHADRITENAQIFDFTLDAEDFAYLDTWQWDGDVFL